MIEAKVEQIGPGRAEQLLGRMAPNRNVRRFKVAKYADDMAAGRWRLTGEAIKLAADGTVIDGEHRLRAIIKSGVTIQSLVVYGVDLDDRVAMDTGANRRLADHLRFLGETHCEDLASALLVLYSRNRKAYTHYLEPSHQELLAEFGQHPGLRESVGIVQRPAKLLRMPRGMCAALHYDMANIDASDAGDFWERLHSGTGLMERDAILVLRRRMEENALARTKKLERVTVHAFIVKAWNAYREGREMGILRWTRGGSNPESFPELV